MSGVPYIEDLVVNGISWRLQHPEEGLCDVQSMNQRAPEIQRLSRQASDDLEKAVDRSFRLGLVLIAVLLTGAVLAGLVYRFLAEKLKQRAGAGGG